MWESLLIYSGCGALAGIAAGLFGVGGGIIVVPFLAWQFAARGVPEHLVMLTAVATSLATIAVTSISSVLAHHRLGAIRWEAVLRLIPGITSGALLGALAAQHLPVPVFKLVFGLFLFGVALRMLWRAGAMTISQAPVFPFEFAAIGALIGLASAILGIGGGALSVPYLVKKGFAIRNAVAVSTACGFPIAVAGTVGYVLLGWNRPELPPLSVGYVYLPAFAGIALTSAPFAPVGARLAHRLPAARLKRFFAMVLIALGARLLWQGMASP